MSKFWRGSSGEKSKGVAAVSETDQNNKGSRIPNCKDAVTAAAIVLVVTFVLSHLILGWVASIAMGIFMAAFVGILISEDRE